MVTYSVLLFAPIIGLPDANTEAFIVDGLIGALSHRLAALVGEVAAHLWRHRGQ